MDNKVKQPYWAGHRERLRRRAKAGGLEALRPHEILETLLGYVVPRVDLSDVARALIDAFGSVEAVLDSDRDRLMAVPGVTRRMADWLLSTGELISAYCGIRQESQFRIWRYRDMLDFLAPRWRSVSAPQIQVIYTDYDDHLLCCMKLSDSLCCDDPACARELMENALVLEARYVYLVGYVGLEPLELYPGEIEHVQALGRLLSAIDVRLVDFVLVGELGFGSLCKEGRLEDLRMSPEAGRLRERYLGEYDDDDEGIEYDDGDRPLYEGEPGTL